MNKLRKYVLGKPAIKYSKEVMADGLTIFKQILEVIDINQGYIYTVLPDGVDINAIKDYDQGGFTDDYTNRRERVRPIITVEEHVLESIQSFLSACNGNPTCVLEEAISHPDDPCMKRVIAPYALYQQEIYYYLTQRSNLESIKEAIKEAHSAYPPLLASMANLTDEDAAILESGQISLEFIKRFAEKTEHIIVGAFDLEGYLIWDKL